MRQQHAWARQYIGGCVAGGTLGTTLMLAALAAEPGQPSLLVVPFHVKVRAPGQPILTTQLYFPEAQQYNRNDPFFDPRLLVTWLEPPKNRTAVYHFVLNQS